LRADLTNDTVNAVDAPASRGGVAIAPPEGKRAIPSLDGLRAFSVLAVILGHTQSAALDRVPFNAIVRKGELGVNVFFVISGFLITHLLVKELNRSGKISLKRFYFRRSFRIFPPFYAFLLIVILMHLPDVTPALLFDAASYTWNYTANAACWILGHSWSLAVEEQFYLLWPLCMVFFGRVKSLWIAIGVVLLSPCVRVASYYAFPSTRTHLPIMTHTHMDPIMAGCALALMIDLKLWEGLRNKLMHPLSVAASLIFLLGVDTYASKRYEGAYLLTAGFSLDSLAIASVLLFVVFRHHSWLGRLLNTAPLRHLGMISYSLYLWQQVFTGPRTHAIPINWLWILICAELSYLLIERPSFWLRDRTEKKFTSWLRPRRSATDAAA
jgi:peptidoglycan/LPS O-acetylase OafA/YrhL